MSHSLTTKHGNQIHLGSHVAAILCSNKDREALAEEVLLKQEYNLALQQQMKKLMTDKRHLEVELNKSRQILSQVLQQPGCPALAGQPVLTLQEQSALLNTLEQQEAELQDTQQQVSYKDALAAHLACVLQQVREAAEAAADTEEPSQGNCLAHDLLDLLEAFQTPVAAPDPSAHPVSSLTIAQAAHKVLLQQALLLRGKLPAPPAEFSHASARPRSPVSSTTPCQKATDVLAFLQSHAQRIQDLLLTLTPGSSSPLSRSRCASPETYHHRGDHGGQQHYLQDEPQHRSWSAQPGVNIFEPFDPQQAATGLGLLGPVNQTAQRPQTAVAPARLRPPTQRCQSASPAGGRAAALPSLSARFGATAVGLPYPSGRHEPDGLKAIAERGSGGICKQAPARMGPFGSADLRPYLTFPPKRPSSPSATSRRLHSAMQQRPPAHAVFADVDAVSNQVVLRLQDALADREEQVQQQQQQCWQLQEQLQQALQQLAHAQGQLCAADAQAVAATAASTALQDDKIAAEQAAVKASEDSLALQVRLAEAEQAAAATSALQERLAAAERAAAEAAKACVGLQEQLAIAEQAAKDNAALHEQLAAAEHAAAEATAASAALQQRLTAAEQATALREQLCAAEAAVEQLKQNQQQGVPSSQQDSTEGQADQISQLQQQLAVAEASAQRLERHLQAQQGDVEAQLLAAQDAAAAQASQADQLRQQLTAAEVQVLDLQQQLHAQQVQHIQAEQEWRQQLDKAFAAVTAPQALAPADGAAAGSMEQVAALLLAHAEHLAVLQPKQALLTEAGELQEHVMPLCEAVQRLVATVKQVAAQVVQQAPTEAEDTPAGAMTAGRLSGTTEVLEGQLEATAAEMDDCMTKLTEVVEATRRATAVGLLGPEAGTVKRFSQLTDVKALSGGGAATVGRISDESV